MAKRVKAPEANSAPTPQAGATRPVYQPIDVGAAKAQTARKSLFFNLEDGTNIVRVLPQFNGQRTLFAEQMLHYTVLSEDGERKIAPGCLHYYRNEPCYLCDFVSWLERKGLLDDEMAKLRAQSKLNAQVYVQDRVTKEWRGPFLMAVPKGVATSMTNWLSMAQDTGTPFFVDPVAGSPVAITKTGKGKGTRYEAVLVPKVENLDDLVPDWGSTVIQDINPRLDTKVLSRDEQKKALFRTFPHLPWAEIQADIK